MGGIKEAKKKEYIIESAMEVVRLFQQLATLWLKAISPCLREALSFLQLWWQKLGFVMSTEQM